MHIHIHMYVYMYMHIHMYMHNECILEYNMHVAVEHCTYTSTYIFPLIGIDLSWFL